MTKHSKGATTYTLRRKLAVLVNSITSFSDRPLVFIFYVGLTIGGAGIAGRGLPRRSPAVLWGSPAWLAVAHRLGMASRRPDSGVGIVGIYLSRVFIETKQRPYTIVRHVYERTTEHAVSSASSPRSRATTLSGFAQFGATPQGVDWNSADSQALRFGRLLELLEDDGARRRSSTTVAGTVRWSTTLAARAGG